MKQITLLLLLGTVLLMGCQTTSRKYEKNASGGVVVTTTLPDGSLSKQTYSPPTLEKLKELGINDEDAVQLLEKGTVAESVSREPTTFGWVCIVIGCIIIFIIVASSKRGGADAAATMMEAAADVLD